LIPKTWLNGSLDLGEVEAAMAKRQKNCRTKDDFGVWGATEQKGRIRP